MRAAATAADRDPDAIEVICGGARTVEDVERFRALGVTEIVVPPPAWDLEGLEDGFTRYSSEVIAPTNG